MRQEQDARIRRALFLQIELAPVVIEQQITSQVKQKCDFQGDGFPFLVSSRS